MNLQRYLEIATECRSIAEEIESGPLYAVIQTINEGVRVIGRASSRSWIGYQAHVYYQGFRIPPPGDHFSSEWGFEGAFNPTSKNWVEVSFEEVEAAVNEVAGNPDITPLETRSTEVSKVLRTYQSELVALLTVALESFRSGRIEELRNKAKDLQPPSSASELASAAMPRGQVMTRDSSGSVAGLSASAPHSYFMQIGLYSFSFSSDRRTGKHCRSGIKLPAPEICSSQGRYFA